MMLPFTPFSGISLIVHLLIILLAKIYILYQVLLGQRGAEVIDSMSVEQRIKDSLFTTWLKTSLSLFVISVLLIATISFIFVAITSAYKEGSDEPHRTFMESSFSYVREEPISVYASEYPVVHTVWDKDEINN